MPLTPANVSLGEFIRELALRFDANGIHMPFNEDQPWHELLYSFKKQPGAKPSFFDALIFDWTGPAPRSRDLAEYLNSLHRIGYLSAANPSFDEVVVDDEVQRLWHGEEVSPELDQYLGRVVERARELFPVA
jgi:hypothetical protein